MDYKGFNIAVHELGHNVEQTFSLQEVDSTLLQGVPNTAFTEAVAFVFQARDLEVLGLPAADAEAKRLLALNDLWMTWEIAGVALVDLGVWHWMYEHPGATPAELREATLGLARAGLEPLVRAGARPARRHPAGRLLPHDRRLPLPARLPARPPHLGAAGGPASRRGRPGRWAPRWSG